MQIIKAIEVPPHCGIAAGWLRLTDRRFAGRARQWRCRRQPAISPFGRATTQSLRTGLRLEPVNAVDSSTNRSSHRRSHGHEQGRCDRRTPCSSTLGEDRVLGRLRTSARSKSRSCDKTWTLGAVNTTEFPSNEKVSVASLGALPNGTRVRGGSGAGAEHAELLPHQGGRRHVLELLLNLACAYTPDSKNPHAIGKVALRLQLMISASAADDRATGGAAELRNTRQLQRAYLHLARRSPRRPSRCRGVKTLSCCARRTKVNPRTSP